MLAANRDEFYQRPSTPVHVWPSHPQVLAGQDLTAGGTWLGMTRNGRFAALTNFRDPANIRTDAPSRGALVVDFLTGIQSPADYMAAVAQHGERYNGFNLLVGTWDELWYYGNTEGQAPRSLPPGTYGLSNATLDTPWPKVLAGKIALENLLATTNSHAPTALLDLLLDETEAPEDALPATGVPLELERLLSRLCIRSDHYGTCCQSVLLWQETHQGRRIRFTERTTNPLREPTYVDVGMPVDN